MVDVYDVIRGHEGYRPDAYWDKTAYRVGYGSDTYVDSEGKVRKVTATTTGITRAQAEADLARRVTEFTNDGVLGYVDRTAWESLPQVAKDQIVSVAYNYGSLSELRSLRNAINAGDVEGIADAIEAYGSHNDGENRRRRTQEANAIRSAIGVTIPPGEIPNTVATEIDLNNLLPGGAPVPRHRFEGDAARFKSSSRAPKPASRVQMAQAEANAIAKQAMLNEAMQKQFPSMRLPAIPNSSEQGMSMAGTEGARGLTLKNPADAAGKISSNVESQRAEQNAERKRQAPKPAASQKISLPDITIGQTTIPKTDSSQKSHDLGTLTPTNSPGIMRINGPNQAGQQAMPRDVRPNVTVPNLDRIAETLPNGSTPKRVTPGSHGGFAGQDGTKASAKKTGLSTPLSPKQTAIERVTTADLALTLSANANLSQAKREQDILRGQKATQVVAAPKAGAPKGKSDSGSDNPLKITVEADKPEEGFNLLGSLGMKSEAKQLNAFLGGITDLFGGDSSKNRSSLSRSPLSASQIASANKNSQNHNSAALAAINKGERSYTGSDGGLQPTTAMNGNVRNTYGD